MGTHGRRGVHRLALGSIAEHVVRGSSVPVLTVRGGEKEGDRVAPTGPLSQEMSSSEPTSS